VRTPLLADAWEHELRKCALLDGFGDVVNSIRFGFDMGIRSTIPATHTPPNHASAINAPAAVNTYIHEQLALGHYTGPFSRDTLESLIGFFRTSPLGVIPKSDGSDRIIQDLSAGDREHPSVNSRISSDEFPTEWGTLLIIIMMVLQAPKGSFAATMDVDAAFRRCPVRPDQQNHFVVMWDGAFYLDHCVAFGGASACGVFGRLADAFVAICRARGMAPCTKWVDDFVFITHPPASPDLPRYCLDDLIALGARLGWPWKPSKTSPFDDIFTYLGFRWSLSRRTVEIPVSKKEKYLTRLAPWTAGAQVSRRDAEIVLGTLVHCALAVPDGRTRLVALTRMVSAFDGARSRFSRWNPGAAVLDDIAYWRAELAKPFCGSALYDPPPPSSVEFWVDASTSFGVGVVFNGQWIAWKLRTGWEADGREIGWAEMIAIELGIRVAIELGFRDTHFVVRSDNTGVIGSVGAGKARNLEQNRSLQRIVALMRANNIWITSQYVASAANIADAPSRGIPAAARTPLSTHIPLPPCLALYIED
jgi:hypothetical protein